MPQAFNVTCAPLTSRTGFQLEFHGVFASFLFVFAFKENQQLRDEEKRNDHQLFVPDTKNTFELNSSRLEPFWTRLLLDEASMLRIK